VLKSVQNGWLGVRSDDFAPMLTHEVQWHR
jgi:hypothetical protein